MTFLKSLFVWVIAIVFVVVFFPLTFVVWLIVLPFDKDRRVIHDLLMYQSFILVRLIPLWEISVEGREKADRKQTYVIISNHQSILDILLANYLRYRYKWISKIENNKVPVLGWYLKMAKYLSVDRGNDQSREELFAMSLEYLRRGISIMIFPEGTRSRDKEVGFFKRGAFVLAIDSGMPVLPVVIDGTGAVLPKHGFIFGSGYKLKIKVLDPVFPADFGTDDPNELASRFKIMIENSLYEMRKEL